MYRARAWERRWELQNGWSVRARLLPQGTTHPRTNEPCNRELQAWAPRPLGPYQDGSVELECGMVAMGNSWRECMVELRQLLREPLRTFAIE